VRDDVIIPFQVGDGAVRGRIVRLGVAIDEILGPHGFADAPSELLGEAAALTALMGSSLKFDGKLIFQAQGEGDVRLLVADYSSDGAIRATATIAGAASSRGLSRLMGKGHLAMTIDQGPDMERYQGVTPIEGKTLEEAAEAYFDQSEQIPTAVRLAVGKVIKPGENPAWRAGGVIVQFMPGEGGSRERGEAVLNSDDDREAWDRAAAFLKSTQADELLDPALSPEELLYRLYHEDGVRVFEAKSVRAACACNAGKISAVLSRYTAEDLSDLADDGLIKVSCEFCRKDYYFDAEGREAQR
jgi:molecular chaperone Hsp33